MDTEIYSTSIFLAKPYLYKKVRINLTEGNNNMKSIRDSEDQHFSFTQHKFLRTETRVQLSLDSPYIMELADVL